MTTEKTLRATMVELTGEYTELSLMASLIDRLEKVLERTPGAAEFFEIIDAVSFNPRKITIAQSQANAFLIVVSLGQGIGMTLTVHTTALLLQSPVREG